jgi:NAD+ diphosphatase
MGPISKVYGPEAFNYYTGNHLNRLSFLRDNYEFLNLALKHPSTRFMAIKKLDALMRPVKRDGVDHEFVFVGYEDVKDVVGDPFYAPEDQVVASWSSKRDAIGVKSVLVVFLGIDESKAGISFRDRYHGQAYFAVNLSPELATTDALKGSLDKILAGLPADSCFKHVRFGPTLDEPSYALYAQARMYVDWNNRNKFCGGCGARNMSVNGGCKLLCPSHDDGFEQPSCETRGTISNLSFPRTDSSIIVAVVNHSRDKLLLGANKRFPKGFYSCLAGYMEPAESVEECVRREVWEESGVKVGRVVVHSTQPWPYPANLMIGCIAEVDSEDPASHQIHLGHDPELVDAQWFSFDEIRQGLQRARQTGYDVSGGYVEGQIRLPKREAIAHVLLEAVVSEQVFLTHLCGGEEARTRL